MKTIRKSSLKVDRFKRILEVVETQKRVSLAELEKELAVSRITIQRDLVELENRKLLKRFHGGAMSVDYDEHLFNHDYRKNMNIEVKRKIAKKAVDLIPARSYIGLDASSTVYYMSEHLFPEEVVVLTPGVDTFLNLANQPNLQLVLTGGKLNRTTGTLTGQEAVGMIRHYHFDLVFISVQAFVPGVGFLDPDTEEVAIKKALLAAAQKIVILLDSSKIVPATGVVLSETDKVDYLVVENPDYQELKRIFKQKLI